MQQITSYNQLLTNISEHPEYPYIIIDFLVVNDEKVDLWCSQRTSSFIEDWRTKVSAIERKSSL